MYHAVIPCFFVENRKRGAVPSKRRSTMKKQSLWRSPFPLVLGLLSGCTNADTPADNAETNAETETTSPASTENFSDEMKSPYVVDLSLEDDADSVERSRRPLADHHWLMTPWAPRRPTTTCSWWLIPMTPPTTTRTATASIPPSGSCITSPCTALFPKARAAATSCFWWPAPQRTDPRLAFL